MELLLTGLVSKRLELGGHVAGVLNKLHVGAIHGGGPAELLHRAVHLKCISFGVKRDPLVPALVFLIQDHERALMRLGGSILGRDRSGWLWRSLDRVRSGLLGSRLRRNLQLGECSLGFVRRLRHDFIQVSIFLVHDLHKLVFCLLN